MAAAIKDELKVETELVEGGRGEFTVWVGDACVAKKDDRGFPEERQAVAAVRAALAAAPG